MSRILSHYLKDFGSEQPVVAMPVMPIDDETIFDDVVEVPPVDIEAERREAYAEGHEAATQSLGESHRAEIEALQAAHQAALDQLHATFEAEAAERIAAGLRQIALSVGQTVGDETATVLSAIMTESLTAKATGELAALVTAAILDGAVGPITVTGPRPLFDALVVQLGANGALLTHIEAQDVDLCVAIDDSVLVTRMSAWADSVRKVLA